MGKKRTKSRKIMALMLGLMLMLSLVYNVPAGMHAQEGVLASGTDAICATGESSLNEVDDPDIGTTENSAVTENPAAAEDSASTENSATTKQAGNIDTISENTGLELGKLPTVAADNFRADNFSAKVNGEELKAGDTVNNGANVEVKFDWSIADNTYGEGDNSNIYHFDLKAKGVVMPDTSPRAFSDGGISGTWWVKDGEFYIELDSTSNEKSGRKGYATLDGIVSGDKGNTETKQQTNFQIGDKSCEITIDMSTSELWLNMQKNAGTAKVEADGIYQQYTVTLTPYNEDITLKGLTDNPGSKLSLKSGSEITVTYPAGTTGRTETFDSWAALNSYFVSNPFELEEGKTLTVTYEDKVDDSVFADNGQDSAGGYSNTVTADFEKEDGTSKQQEATSYGVTVKQPSVTKKGEWADAAKTKIKWTITINPGDMKWDDVQSIKDTLGDYLESEVSGWTGKDFTIDQSNFTANGDGTYTYTYQTKVDEKVLKDPFDHTFDNKVEVELQYNSSTFTRDAVGTIGTEKNPDFMKKEFSEYDPATGEIKWKVSVSVPESMAGASVSPSMREVTIKDNVNSDNHLLVKKIYLEDDLIYDESGMTALGNNYLTSADDNNSGFSWGDLTLHFKDTYIAGMEGKTIELTFVTKVNADSHGTYRNNATLTYTTPYDEKKTETDEADYNPQALLTKEGEQTTSDDGSKKRNAADYTLGLKTEKLKGELKAGDVLTFSDTLPEHMMLDETVAPALSYQADHGTFTSDLNFAGGPSITCQVTPYQENQRQKITFSLTVTEDFIRFLDDPGSFGNWQSGVEVLLRLKYRAVIDPDYVLEFTEKGTQTVVNDVEAYLNDTSLGNADASVEMVPADLVDKDGVYVPGDSMIPYTIYANLDRVDLSDGDFVQGTDISGSALILDPKTISVSKYVGTKDPYSDTEGWIELTANKDYFYTYNTKERKAVFTLPDETALKITYQCKINLYFGDENSDNNDELTSQNSRNTFVLEGVVNSKGESENFFNLTLSRARVGGIAETATIDLYKYWTDGNQMVALNGSVFELRRCITETVNGVVTVKENGDIYKGLDHITLDKDGRTQITDLEYQNVYALCEIDADEGFEIGEPYYFAVYYQKSTTTPQLSDDIDKFFQEGTIYYENKADWEVNVNKVDKESGMGLAGASLVVTGNGKQVDAWVTDGNPHRLSADLFKTNTEYVLTEEKAPDGYAIASPITFKLDDKGNVSIKGKDGSFTLLESDLIVMEDEKETTTTEDSGSTTEGSGSTTENTGVTTETSTSSETSTSASTSTGTTTVTTDTGTDSVKTGDDTMIKTAIIFLVASAAGIMLIAAKRKRR